MKASTKIFAGIAATAAALTVGFAAIGLTGCGGIEINISGSTSVQPLMEKLVEAYTKDNPDVIVNISGGGSGVGVSDAQKGNVDFGMASRALKFSETGVTATKIADDGIALVVKADSSVTAVTAREIYGMYADKTAIRTVITTAVGRESGSGTRSAFDELIGNSDGETLAALASGYANGIGIYNSTAALKESVAGNSAAIGYISMGSVDATVRALDYEGVAATTENVRNGAYRLSRPFNLVIPSGGLNDNAQGFVNFILGDAGQAIVAEDGYIGL